MAKKCRGPAHPACLEYVLLLFVGAVSASGEGIVKRRNEFRSVGLRIETQFVRRVVEVFIRLLA